MKKQLHIIALGIVLLLTGCKEFIEPSLKERKMVLLAPSDKLESSTYLQTFWWETQEDALRYRLQVVSPKFDSVAVLVLDTVIYGDKFSHTLDPGKYEWRIRAENGSSATNYFSRAFVIHPSSLTGQTLQVKLPANTLVTANSELRYEWLNLFGASRYRLQVDTNGFSDTTKLVLNIETENLSFIQKLKQEGRYEFRIRAENASQLSKWSTLRYFIFDNSPPEQVVLTTPTNKQGVSAPVKLQWKTVADAEKYELLVYKSDSVTVLQNYPQITNGNVATLSGGAANDRLTWRVRAIDKAGNKGSFSTYFSFTLQ